MLLEPVYVIRLCACCCFFVGCVHDIVSAAFLFMTGGDGACWLTNERASVLCFFFLRFFMLRKESCVRTSTRLLFALCFHCCCVSSRHRS